VAVPVGAFDQGDGRAGVCQGELRLSRGNELRIGARGRHGQAENAGEVVETLGVQPGLALERLGLGNGLLMAAKPGQAEPAQQPVAGAFLGVAQREYCLPMSIHTPSTGPAYETRHVYDASVVLGETENPSLIVTVGAISRELATGGYFALIGRDVLSHCRLIYDGLQSRFSVEYDAR